MKGWTRRGILTSAALLPPTALALTVAAKKARAQALGGADALVRDETPLPPVRFTTADGAERTLADYAGRPVLLNFWATWCVPCVAEMPALDRLAAAMPALAVLPLSSDRQGAPAVDRFFAAHNIAHLPTLLDPRAAAAHATGLRGIPTTVAIAASGAVVARAEGPVEWDTPSVAAWIAEHLGSV